MASDKEIRTKIKSVTNTRKITKAMEMVAASKMRKAQDRMQAAMGQGMREDVDFSKLLEFIASCSGLKLESENVDVPTGLETE